MTAEELRPGQENFLRDAEEVVEWERDPKDPKKGITLAEVVKRAKPTVLIGCSTMQGAFNESVRYFLLFAEGLSIRGRSSRIVQAAATSGHRLLIALYVFFIVRLHRLSGRWPRTATDLSSSL